MITAKINWTQELVWDYIKTNIIPKTKGQRIITLVYAIIYVLGIIGCVVSYFISNDPMCIGVALMATAVLIIFGFILIITLKSYSKKLYKANVDTEVQSECAITPESIILIMGDKPRGQVSWDNIEEITVTKKAAYLITSEKALLIIDFEQLISGNKDELMEIINERKNKLSAKA